MTFGRAEACSANPLALNSEGWNRAEEFFRQFTQDRRGPADSGFYQPLVLARKTGTDAAWLHRAHQALRAIGSILSVAFFCRAETGHRPSPPVFFVCHSTSRR